MQLKLTLSAAAALSLLAGIASAQDVQVVKIGHVAPMSGAQAHYGKDNENGARMAVEDLNTQNIVIGGKKIKFELAAEDDAADPKQGTAAAQKLVAGRWSWPSACWPSSTRAYRRRSTTRIPPRNAP